MLDSRAQRAGHAVLIRDFHGKLPLAAGPQAKGESAFRRSLIVIPTRMHPPALPLTLVCDSVFQSTCRRAPVRSVTRALCAPGFRQRPVAWHVALPRSPTRVGGARVRGKEAGKRPLGADNGVDVDVQVKTGEGGEGSEVVEKSGTYFGILFLDFSSFGSSARHLLGAARLRRGRSHACIVRARMHSCIGVQCYAAAFSKCVPSSISEAFRPCFALVASCVFPCSCDLR